MTVPWAPWLRDILCLLLATVPSAVVALDPAHVSASAPEDVAATSDAVKWVVKIPPDRGGHAMAYDDARGRLVLFGGEPNLSPFFSDTWVWDGNTWTQKSPAASPPGRIDHAMAYDGARGHVVLFGGYGGLDWDFNPIYLADTWEWDGTTWAQRTPVTSPHARDGHAMAYDSARGRVVLFGGHYADGTTQYLADTWEWDGTTWIQRTPAVSPPARLGHAMAYDSARGRVVLFGGYYNDGAGQYLADTWEWDGDTWVQLTPGTSPSARYHHAMAYDSARGRVVLFGGSGLADTWEWDGNTWVQRTPATGPAYRYRLAMAYDSARGRVVLFGGSGSSWLGDTWEWDGNTWAQKAASPEADQGQAMAYDSARGRVVLLGSHYDGATRLTLADTWEWDGNTWLLRTPATSPPGRRFQRMAYDSARERVVLFGGQLSTYFADTWEWDGGTWVQRTPATSPVARGLHAMAYDSARGRVVLFGGRDSTNSRLADTWEWDGDTWVQRSPATSPPARYGHAMAYDSARGRVVLFGGYDSTSTRLADTWEWDGSSWILRTPATSPVARRSHAMAYDSARGQVVLFGGRGDNSGLGYATDLLNDTWEWDGSHWVLRFPATNPDLPSLLGPTMRELSAMAYDSVRGVVVLFGGHNWALVGDLWEYGPANHTPAADAGPDQVLECTGNAKATAALDASGSTDVDSTPRTNDDIAGFVWSESGTTLASGETASVPLPLGEHSLLLTVTDRAGATGTDGTIVTVQDNTPPVLTCPSSVSVECQAAGQSQILLPPATASDLCFGAVPITNDRTPNGADASGFYPLGVTTIAFITRDGSGNQASCQAVVTVTDLDGDGVCSLEDNCPSAYNPDRADADLDGHGDACDCAPGDATIWAVPQEVPGLVFADATTLGWDSVATQAGPGTVYDLLRGELAELPVGSGAAESCVGSGRAGTTATDPTAPAPNSGFYYVVRGGNVCGRGSWGYGAGEAERTSAACP